jgi:hypothetical protein
MYSNFIGPPDFVDDDNNHTVLIIEPDQKTILDLGLICKSAGTDFNVYFYHHNFDDLAWLEKAFNRANAVIINTDPTPLSYIKDRLVDHPKSYIYGPKNFLGAMKKLESAQQYFILYVQKQQKIGFST